MFKSFIQRQLESLTKQYLAKHRPTLIVVGGSVGKTSTKLAIATVLAETMRVRTHEGNHNTQLSAPTAILGIEFPSNPKSVLQWLHVFVAALGRIQGKKDVDVIIAELGTDQPGDISHFGTYLHPDVAVVTAVSPEHMEFFGSIEGVAKEELGITEFSEFSIINRDDVSGQYADLAHTENLTTYGLTGTAEYLFVTEDFTLADGYTGKVATPGLGEFPLSVHVASEQTLKSAVAAVAVAARLGLSREQIESGVKRIVPTHGRMNLLRGVNDSIILDDTYNSSPLAAAAALTTLYGLPTSQRIAILGSMNELGASSESEHRRLGELCDPGLLAWVLTVGEDAAKWLAPAARQRGCQVKSFKSPYAAGAFAHKILESGAIVLAKGSQNGVYAEEAVKMILHATAEESQLVRQSPEWIKRKEAQFL